MVRWFRSSAQKGLTLVVLLTLTITACGDQSRRPASVPLPLDLPQVPDGLSVGRAGTFPQDSPTTAAPYSIRLWTADSDAKIGSHRISSGADLAVFTRAAPMTMPAGGAPRTIPNVGPGNIVGTDTASHGTEILCASRALPVTELRSAGACGTPDGTKRPPGAGWTEVVYERSSTLPGFGSLPMASLSSGYVISYVGSTSDVAAAQPSIEIGSYPGSEADLRLLDWWLKSGKVSGPPDQHEYRIPAYTSFGEGGNVPLATLLGVVREGSVVLVRVTDVPLTPNQVLVQLRYDTLTHWRSLSGAPKKQ